MTCIKKAYPDLKAARTALNETHRSRHRYGQKGRFQRTKNKRPERAYRCEYCGMYHLTSKRK